MDKADEEDAINLEVENQALNKDQPIVRLHTKQLEQEKVKMKIELEDQNAVLVNLAHINQNLPAVADQALPGNQKKDKQKNH